MIYSSDDLLRIAKRVNNNKRRYLLVNPLQAKHMPVSPTAALSMMKALGNRLAEKYPRTRLVIGFAETATAIGAAVAESISPSCIYVHTTRENIDGVLNWIEFQEEHSHAVEQRLVGDELARWISKTETIIFVDDEISTGKTLRNMIALLKDRYAGLKGKQLVAASLLNGLSAEDEQKMAEAGIYSEYLVKTPNEDFADLMEKYSISEASETMPIALNLKYQALFAEGAGDPRRGIEIGRYAKNCEKVAETFLIQFIAHIQEDSRILVLGTEECMYPALSLGRTLEMMGRNYSVRCHSTTRSPIGISSMPAYPIAKGSKIISFYDNHRETYIYELSAYDAVIVVSDTRFKDFSALEKLAGALPIAEHCQLFYVRNGREVFWTSIQQGR